MPLGRDPRLWWIIAPHIAYELWTNAGADTAQVPSVIARSLARIVLRRTGPKISRVGPVAVVSTGVQTDRIVGSLADLAPQGFLSGSSSRLPLAAGNKTLGSWRSAASLIAALDRLSGNGYERLSRRFAEAVFDYANLRERALRLFQAPDGPRVLVVATQHGSATRAILSAALDVGSVRTVYVPHAPLARNVFYHDLPVHWALLRGPREVSTYQELGAAASGLSSCGDPTIEPPRTTSRSDATKVVFAASSENPNVLAEQISVLRDADLPEVEVCPHPRMRERGDLMSLFPREWARNPLRSTFDRLATSPVHAVVQQQSGVGLEALSLGIPVINLLAPGEQNNYYFLDSEHVTPVSSTEQLVEALDAKSIGTAADWDRRRYAAEWTGISGRAATEMIIGQIERIVDEPVPAQLVLDGWQGR